MENFNPVFEIKDFDVAGRLGVFKLGNKTLETPALFPVVSPFENAVAPRKLFDHFKFQSLFTNAYIIYKKRHNHPEFLEKGLHNVLDFPGIIATDSGGFQDYMYGGDLKITPEEIEPFQEQIGSDCPVILDIPIQISDSPEVALNKLDVTMNRARANIQRRTRKNCAWFGPIHGSIFTPLLERSTKEMSQLDFGLYAIGGVVKTFIDYRFDLDIKILLQVKQWINPHRPLHMFGLGLPSFFALAVACGADTFDSAAYYLYAKDNRYFTLQGTKSLEELTEFPCHCPICSQYTPKELLQESPQVRVSRLAEHNLYLSMGEIRTIRQAIREGNLWDLVESRVPAHPKLIKALRVTRDFQPFLESLIVSEKTHGFKYTSENSFYRPEMTRFFAKIRQIPLDPTIKGLILLPELDIPSLTSPMMRTWAESLQSAKIPAGIEIYLISNLFGLFPLSLNEIYPLSHHEGNPDHALYSPITQKLIETGISHLKTTSVSAFSIYALTPTTFINEYNEPEAFSLPNHILSHFITQIRQQCPHIQLTSYSTLEDLISGVKIHHG